MVADPTGPTGNPNDLRQQMAMVKKFADALDHLSKQVPVDVRAKRLEGDAALGAAWQGEARRAYDIGANLMENRVQETCRKVGLLAEGVQSAGTTVAANDVSQGDNFKAKFGMLTTTHN
ncbi:MAG: hypothetical protein ACRCYU_15010 [Nocardioides sp.]